MGPAWHFDHHVRVEVLVALLALVWYVCAAPQLFLLTALVGYVMRFWHFLDIFSISLNKRKCTHTILRVSQFNDEVIAQIRKKKKKKKKKHGKNVSHIFFKLVVALIIKEIKCQVIPFCRDAAAGYNLLTWCTIKAHIKTRHEIK